jgi:hypothetical protein
MSTLGRPGKNIYEKNDLDLFETLFIETTCKSTDVNRRSDSSRPRAFLSVFAYSSGPATIYHEPNGD